MSVNQLPYQSTTFTTGSVPSCLKNQNDPPKKPLLDKRVSFPDDDKDVVTGYFEPANPWEYADNFNQKDLVDCYKSSCDKHGVRPLSRVISQLQVLDCNLDRNEILDLKGEILGPSACETLEEILKRVQFVSINLECANIDDESAVALFDMIEYYESALRLNIAGNHCVAARGWQACSRMIKRTKCLEELDVRNTTLNEQFMPILSRALRLATQLHVLKLENCNLSGRPIVILAAALKLNTGLKELYLGDNFMMEIDAAQLSALLKVNTVLQLMDISNNSIKDEGLGFIVEGLLEQSGGGLQVLVLWNNRLSRSCGLHLARLFTSCASLETLNIGQNVLSNEVLYISKFALQKNCSLLRLGMQSTHLSCEGAVSLAEIIAHNPTIQRIDLRDNNMQVAGLMALSLSVKVNQSVTQLDLDDMPRRKHSMGPALEEYLRLVAEIRGYCKRNSKRVEEIEEVAEEVVKEVTVLPNIERRPRAGSFATRKISLTCETLARCEAQMSHNAEQSQQLLVEPKRTGGRLRSPAPSPIPSPVTSPSPTRSRFQVCRVAESDSPITPPSYSPNVFFGGSSRFKVTVVETSDTSIPTTVVTPNNITVGFETPTCLSPNIAISPAPSPTPIPAPLLSSISSLFPTPMLSPLPSPGVSPYPSPTYIPPMSSVSVDETVPLFPLPGRCDEKVRDEPVVPVVSDIGRETLLNNCTELSVSDINRSVNTISKNNDNSVLKDNVDSYVSFVPGSIFEPLSAISKDNYSFNSRDSVSPTKPYNVRSESEESDKDALLNRKLPKAIDSIDLSASRVIKQASVSVSDKAPTPSQRERKKSSWTQPSTMFSSIMQDDSGKPSSSLERLLGLFVNPFTRSKVEDEPTQQLERVPEIAESSTLRNESETTDVSDLSKTSIDITTKMQQSITSVSYVEQHNKICTSDNNIKDNLTNKKNKSDLQLDDKSSYTTRNGDEPKCDEQKVNIPFLFYNNDESVFEATKCKTWPQGSSESQLNLAQPCYGQSHSSPCLAALVFHLSTGEMQNVSPPTSEEPVESAKNISLAL